MDNNYDVIVIGGGSSGMMAAIQAGLAGTRPLLLDKNPGLGRKLLLTGGGRCNITNRSSRQDLITHIPGNGKFLYGALDQFDAEDVVDFFQSRGVALKEEDHGRMFPVTDKARTILDALIETLKEAGVTVQTKATVTEIDYGTETYTVNLADGTQFNTRSLILATGGRAYPKTGSTGDGYRWALQADHTILPLYATEVPLISEDPWVQDRSLQGVALRDVTVTAYRGSRGAGKPLTQHRMDMIITHFGYSGPAILRCSGHVNLYLREQQIQALLAGGVPAPHCELAIDLVPDLSREDLQHIAEDQRDRQLSSIFKTYLPERMIQTILDQVKVSPTAAYKQVDHAQVRAFFEWLKAFPLTVTGSQTIEKGFVTGGGVSTKEVNPKTMESKLHPGLYFCGELLDINGYTGGYNLTAALVTGAVAGRHAAWNSL